MQNRLTDLTKSVVTEVVEDIEQLVHVNQSDNKEQIMPVKPEVYLNTIVTDVPDEIDQFVEDNPVCDITEMILAYLDRDEDDKTQHQTLVYQLGQSKAAGKAFLNRVFEFRRYYKSKQEGVVSFYSKKVGYPPANLVADLEYELGVEKSRTKK